MALSKLGIIVALAVMVLFVILVVFAIASVKRKK
jgi:hypothetical protein